MKKFLIKFIGQKKKINKLKDLKINRILLETSCQIGDCIIFSPYLEALSKIKNNEVKIDIIVRENSMDILKYYPYIENIYPYRKYKNRVLRYFYNLYFALKKRNRYDLIISFEKGINTFHLLYLRILNAKYLISLKKSSKYGVSGEELSMYDCFFEERKEIIDILNLDFKDEYKIYLGKYEEVAKNYFSKKNINIIFNYIGSVQEKIIPREEVIKILKKIVKNNTRIYLSSIPSKYEYNKQMIEEINMENIVLLPKTNNIFEMASYIKYSDMLVSVDTSLIHIASTYNKNILGLYFGDKEILKTAAPKTKNWLIVESPYKNKIRDLNIDEIQEKFSSLLTKI